jgi:hypothetical protein
VIEPASADRRLQAEKEVNDENTQYRESHTVSRPAIRDNCPVNGAKYPKSTIVNVSTSFRPLVSSIAYITPTRLNDGKKSRSCSSIPPEFYKWYSNILPMSHAGEDEGRTDANGTVVYRSDGQEDRKLSTAVLEALDSVPGYDIENSDTVVFEHIDLDALDELFTTTNGTSRQGEVTFSVGEYRVTATADGEVIVRTS